MWMRLAIVSALLVSASAHAGAQSAWHDLQVPSAALRILDIPVDRGRAMAMTRAIRILHSVPRPDIVPSQTAELERVLLDLDLVERQISRNGVRAVNLEMAKSATERIALEDALESVGLRLQERNRAYSVEAKTGNEAAVPTGATRTGRALTQVLCSNASTPAKQCLLSRNLERFLCPSHRTPGHGRFLKAPFLHGRSSAASFATAGLRCSITAFSR